MSETTRNLTRRSVLRRTWQTLAAAGFGTVLGQAQSGGAVDRALVCIYLFGGNDSNNMLVPLSQYSSYASARGSLAIPAKDLLPIRSGTSSHADYGLNPALAELQGLFNSRYLAVVSNVGHASSTELASPIDPSLSYFTPGYAVPSWAARLGGITEAARKNLFVGFPNLEPDGDAQTSMALIAPGISGSKELQESLMRIAGRPKGLNTPFPLSGLGQQLRQVASLLKVVPGLGISRPIFVCTLGGFATSSEQLPKQAELFRELSTAMASFHEATVELGISQRVTTYTDSEFSRTLQPNKYNGSDPAWGGHHLVMGGSVLGGQVHGNFPVLQLGGPSDASRNGTWVPTSSKDQYAATLANWYGIQQGHLSTYLPDVVRHAKPTLGFMAG